MTPLRRAVAEFVGTALLLIAVIAAQMVGTTLAAGTIRLLWPGIAAVADVVVVPHDTGEVA